MASTDSVYRNVSKICVEKSLSPPVWGTASTSTDDQFFKPDPQFQLQLQINDLRRKFHQTRCLLVRHLPTDVTKEEVAEMLSAVVPVKRVELSGRAATATSANVYLEDPEMLEDFDNGRKFLLRGHRIPVFPSPSENFLFISRLPRIWTQDDFTRFVESFGNSVTNCLLIISEETGRSKGYGIAIYNTREDAFSAQNSIQCAQILRPVAPTAPDDISVDLLNPSCTKFKDLHSHVLYISNLPRPYDMGSFREKMSLHAKPIYCCIPLHNGVLQDWGLAEYSSASDADATLELLTRPIGNNTGNHPSIIRGNKIDVHYCIPGVRAIHLEKELLEKRSHQVTNHGAGLLPNPPAPIIRRNLENLRKNSPMFASTVEQIIFKETQPCANDPSDLADVTELDDCKMTYGRKLIGNEQQPHYPLSQVYSFPLMGHGLPSGYGQPLLTLPEGSSDYFLGPSYVALNPINRQLVANPQYFFPAQQVVGVQNTQQHSRGKLHEQQPIRSNQHNAMPRSIPATQKVLNYTEKDVSSAYATENTHSEPLYYPVSRPAKVDAKTPVSSVDAAIQTGERNFHISIARPNSVTPPLKQREWTPSNCTSGSNIDVKAAGAPYQTAPWLAYASDGSNNGLVRQRAPNTQEFRYPQVSRSGHQSDSVSTTSFRHSSSSQSSSRASSPHSNFQSQSPHNSSSVSSQVSFRSSSPHNPQSQNSRSGLLSAPAATHRTPSLSSSQCSSRSSSPHNLQSQGSRSGHLSVPCHQTARSTSSQTSSRASSPHTHIQAPSAPSSVVVSPKDYSLPGHLQNIWQGEQHLVQMGPLITVWSEPIKHSQLSLGEDSHGLRKRSGGIVQATGSSPTKKMKQ